VGTLSEVAPSARRGETWLQKLLDFNYSSKPSHAAPR